MLLIQCHEPFWAGWETTWRCLSIDARSVTGTSNRTITGIPMPTVWPASGAIDGKVCWSRLSAAVWKWVVRVTDCPPSMAASLRTVYDVPGSSSVPAVQVFLSADSRPGTGPDFEVTLTAVSVPESAVTEMIAVDRDGGRAAAGRWCARSAWPPRAWTTCSAGRSSGHRTPWSPLELPEPHPAATSDTAIRAPTIIGTRVKDIRLPVR